MLDITYYNSSFGAIHALMGQLRSTIQEIEFRLEEMEETLDINPNVDFHYDTVCNCEDCKCRRNAVRAMMYDDMDIMDDVSYRMD